MKKLTTEQFIQRAKEIYGDRYNYDKVIYNNSREPVTIICSIHNEFQITPDNFLHKNGCAKCSYDLLSNKRLDDKDDFVNKSLRTHGTYYDYTKVTYVNYITKVEILCPLHGSFWQNPSKHIFGQGCPKCKSSKGERIIYHYLVDNDILFLEQYRNSTCKDKAILSFDFYLPNYNLLIEFQGLQHERFIPYYHKTIDNFDKQKLRDNIKRQWAKDNNIQLLEISYKEIDEIQNILFNQGIFKTNP